MSPKELSHVRSRFADVAERLRKFSQKERAKCAISIKAIESHLIMLQADSALIVLLSSAFTALDMGRTDEATTFMERALAFVDAALAAGEKAE